MRSRLYERCWEIASFMISFNAALWRALAEKALPIQFTASPTAAPIPPTMPPLANPCPILEMEDITPCTVSIASDMEEFPIASNMSERFPARLPTIPADSAAASPILASFASVDLFPLPSPDLNNSFTPLIRASNGFFLTPAEYSSSTAFCMAFISLGEAFRAFNCSAVKPNFGVMSSALVLDK